MMRCETIDCTATNVFKSSEHRFNSVLGWLPRRFVLKGKDILLTCRGQSAINIFTASAFNGNFVFVLDRAQNT